MSLEATMLVLDNSSYSINGDYPRTYTLPLVAPAPDLQLTRLLSPPRFTTQQHDWPLKPTRYTSFSTANSMQTRKARSD